MVQGARANILIKLSTIFPTEAYIPLVVFCLSSQVLDKYTHMHFVKKHRICNAKPVAI